MLPLFSRLLGAVTVAALFAPLALFASRVKDLSVIEGGRDNQLVGYGIVVGLAGDGDSNAATTLRSVANLLQRYGLTIPASDIKAKNVAAVMITADITAFIKTGARIDVNVASMGDAKSLQGAILLQSPLLGADGRVYAVAQGPVATGGVSGGAGGAGGASVQKNHPTVGIVSNGGIVEREINATIVRDNTLRLLLHNPDYTTASNIAEAINAKWPASANPVDAATLAVRLPEDYRGRDVAFIAELGQLESNSDTLARIVINERTGTIVATTTVRLSQVAISHGSLTITVTSNIGVSQPNALSNGKTVAVPSTQTAVNEGRGGFTVLNEPPSVERLAAALNALGVSTREMMSIFQTLKRAGALQAELVIN
ncbi:MAG: flagellar basal body P-ring protein FlgI [Undibacterium sp.]|nr:flagellar basal body P-ring protein FlgI [Opitutaceae bacterium]